MLHIHVCINIFSLEVVERINKKVLKYLYLTLLKLMKFTINYMNNSSKAAQYKTFK